jgi:hypothetical protein
VRIDAFEERDVGDGRKLWRDANDRWHVDDWPDDETFESAEVAERLLALEAESPLLAALNRRIVQLGGSPIPPWCGPRRGRGT